MERRGEEQPKMTEVKRREGRDLDEAILKDSRGRVGEERVEWGTPSLNELLNARKVGLPGKGG